VMGRPITRCRENAREPPNDRRSDVAGPRPTAGRRDLWVRGDELRSTRASDGSVVPDDRRRFVHSNVRTTDCDTQGNPRLRLDDRSQGVPA
jgi:hypothetical protein